MARHLLSLLRGCKDRLTRTDREEIADEIERIVLEAGSMGSRRPLSYDKMWKIWCDIAPSDLKECKDSLKEIVIKYAISIENIHEIK